MIDIRLAQRRDAAFVARMSRDLIEYGLGWSWTAMRVLRAIRDRETNVIVAVEGKRIVGFAIMKYFDEQAHLLLFAVAANRQRQGIGRALWGWLEETTSAAGIHTVALEVRARNVVARTFYRRFGFVDVETVGGYYSGVEAAVRMQRRVLSLVRSDKA